VSVALRHGDQLGVLFDAIGSIITVLQRRNHMKRLSFTIPALVLAATLALTNSSDAAKGGSGHAPKAAGAKASPVRPGTTRPSPAPAQGRTFRDTGMANSAPESLAPSGGHGTSSSGVNTARPTGRVGNPGGGQARTWSVFIRSPVTGAVLPRGTYDTPELAQQVADDLRNIFQYEAFVE
jgi:hypothetical protein